MKLNKLTAATLSAVLGLTFVGGVANAEDNNGIPFPTTQPGKDKDETPISFKDLGIDPKQGPTGTDLVNPPKDPEEPKGLQEGPKPREERPRVERPRVERPKQQAPTQQAPAQRTLPRTSAVK